MHTDTTYANADRAERAADALAQYESNGEPQ